MNKFMSTSQAAQKWGLSARRVATLCEGNRIEGVEKVGNSWAIPVDEEGKPKELIGVPAEKIDAYLKDMLNKCKRIQPEYMPITEVADYQGKKFIVVWAPGGSVRPYSSPKTMAKDCRERVYYIRKMASTMFITKAMMCGSRLRSESCRIASKFSAIRAQIGLSRWRGCGIIMYSAAAIATGGSVSS